MDANGSSYLGWLLWMLMVESLDHPHCLFVILGFQFRGKNDNVRNASFGQVSTGRLWSFSNTSAPGDRTLNNPLELPLNLSGSPFLILDSQTENILNKTDHGRRLQRSQEGPSSVPAEYFSPDTILFQKYMALICYQWRWSSLYKKTDLKNQTTKEMLYSVLKF